MTTYLPRSAWNARESRGSSPLNPAEVVGIAVHWPGMAKPIDAVGDTGKARIASALRGWQDYHMDVRGWSDIAYQVAIDQAGRAWTLRGWTRSAANGDTDVNSRYGAALLILGPGEEPTAAMKDTTRNVITDFRVFFPAGLQIKPHSYVRPAGTDCPGDPARAAITRGDFTPTPTIPEDNDMTTEELAALIRQTLAQAISDTKIDMNQTEILLTLHNKVDGLGTRLAAIEAKLS
jgi:hypothetical protein